MLTLQYSKKTFWSDRDLVDDEWVSQSIKRFFDKLECERSLHFRQINDYELPIRLFFFTIQAMMQRIIK